MIKLGLMVVVVVSMAILVVSIFMEAWGLIMPEMISGIPMRIIAEGLGRSIAPTYGWSLVGVILMLFGMKLMF